jgi:aerobic carbon-monoxide dehydrogenase small subunit
MSVVTVVVNGREERMDLAPFETLLDALRNRLHLTGAKDACREGQCGACTVLVDGLAVNSCLFPARAAVGREVLTVEGHNDAVSLALKEAMAVAGAVQCGFCIPGFVVMLSSLLRDTADPDETMIRRAMSGNICRCTGYAQIVEAVLLASKRLRGSAQ